MDCAYIPEISYNEFGERLREKLAQRRYPISGSLELTYRCNLRCQHCYLAFGHNGIPDQQELSLAEIRNILDQAADEGLLWLLVTGGEPLVRKDFKEIWKAAFSRGLIVNLFTNGTLLTPQLADFLAEWQPASIEITLYGHTRQTYESVTGIPGSFDRCRRGIELLLERKMRVNLKTMVLTLNAHELWEMEAYALSLGCGFRYDPMVNAGFGNCSRPAQLRLSPEQVVEVYKHNAKAVEEWQNLYVRYASQPHKASFYTCGAGLKSFHIDPYGKMSVCILSRAQSYDLRQGTFREGFYEVFPQILGQPVAENAPCSGCNLRPVCNQCTGWAEMENGDPQERVLFACQVAHQLAQTLEIM
jgi:radical SAM protein with 4Fe4S-binding SPASM domain